MLKYTISLLLDRLRTTHSISEYRWPFWVCHQLRLRFTPDTSPREFRIYQLFFRFVRSYFIQQNVETQVQLELRKENFCLESHWELLQGCYLLRVFIKILISASSQEFDVVDETSGGFDGPSSSANNVSDLLMKQDVSFTSRLLRFTLPLPPFNTLAAQRNAHPAFSVPWIELTLNAYLLLRETRITVTRNRYLASKRKIDPDDSCCACVSTLTYHAADPARINLSIVCEVKFSTNHIFDLTVPLRICSLIAIDLIIVYHTINK